VYFLFSCTSKDQSNAIDNHPEKIFDIVNNYHAEGLFDGTILVADSSGIIYKGAFGYAGLSNKLLFTNGPQFYLASVSKQFTSTAILLLLQSGKITLQDRIIYYLPELPEIYKTITIKNLLNHTSGIPDYYNFENYLMDLPILMCSMFCIQLMNWNLNLELSIVTAIQAMYFYHFLLTEYQD
jgi:CubicO group peptidase (beta-lactamase class C family)